MIEFIFIAKNESEMSEIMTSALNAAREKFNDTIAVLSQEDCIKLPKEELKTDKKRKVFIFDDFDMKDEAFRYIFTAETVRIMGSRCLLTVLLERIPAPAGFYHIHDLSMKNLVICATNITKEEKQELKQLVLFMGGKYLDDLKDSVTHLISKSVMSQNKTVAQNGVKIMHVDWVKSVWKKAQNLKVIVRGDEAQFDTYKLPYFFNLCITSTGLKAPERNNIKALVEENGGIYSPSFTNAVDILVMKKDSIESLKFNAAVKLKKLCLSAAWILDSVKNGYAMPVESYNLGNTKNRAISMTTKTSDGNLTKAKFNPDDTQLSYLSRSIQQTLIDAKIVGRVLDGFNILPQGFSEADLPFISKIVQVLGATKMDSLNEQVTHVIVGTLDPQIFNDLHEHNVEALVLKVDWLKTVVEKMKLVDERKFEISRPVSVEEKLVPEKLSGVFDDENQDNETPPIGGNNSSSSPEIFHEFKKLLKQRAEEKKKVPKKPFRGSPYEENQVVQRRYGEPSQIEIGWGDVSEINEMKSLYNDEMTKKNQKYEESLAELRETVKQQDLKLTHFEQHNEKLAKTSHVTSEMKLKYEEMQKENEFMRSKIRFMEINGGMQTAGSIGMGRMPSTMTQMNGASLGMEDEAGEEFNNTYLKDLKCGGSELSLDVYSTAELQKRNSMYPQHMRGSYAMLGLDRTVGEQEMKDGGIPFDDSQTALLHTGANRKKQTTSYKRPGPPTPSKMGGRLSIGGPASDVNYTNILKDSTNNAENIVTKKTPNTNRLRNIFSSSSSKFKDELRVRHGRVHTLTPTQLKGGRSYYVVEKDRRDKRNHARDQNRPIYDSASSSPEYENLLYPVNDCDEWSEEEDDEQPKTSRRLDPSLEYIRRREDWNTLQRMNRRSSFNKNRRSSIDLSRQSTRTSDDWGRFQSCVSLEDSSAELFQGPKRSLSQNFVMSHHAQVNRMSDVYVKSSKRSVSQNHANSSDDKKFSWHEVRSILVSFFVALIALVVSKKHP